jgi:hypothetical protein
MKDELGLLFAVDNLNSDVSSPAHAAYPSRGILGLSHRRGGAGPVVGDPVDAHDGGKGAHCVD